MTTPDFFAAILAALVIATSMGIAYLWGKLQGGRSIAQTIKEGHMRLYRRNLGSQTLFRYTIILEDDSILFDSGWRPVSEHLMPDDAPDPDPDADLSDS